MQIAEVIAYLVILAPCLTALFELLTQVVKFLQAIVDARSSKKNKKKCKKNNHLVTLTSQDG
ncbi:hypothetical protein RU97_GL001983 [Enterococcus canis]|uniref:Uncharacterized protein n=1 Tax=Enterococcus canis TaxID=214095 RepID=A0A1L8RFN2_9ENTE|nr:hypothetical protein [Enterococcus canis]OJG18586.1 hypothetical protein RU97_GL001983 [Enterococcus canis]